MIVIQTYFSKHDTLTQCWLMLARRLRRRPSINPALRQCIMFAGSQRCKG